MENENIYTGFLNKLIKVLYKDGDRNTITKGILEKADENFIKLKSLKRTYLININEIVKVEEIENGEREKD